MFIFSLRFFRLDLEDTCLPTEFQKYLNGNKIAPFLKSIRCKFEQRVFLLLVGLFMFVSFPVRFPEDFKYFAESFQNAIRTWYVFAVFCSFVHFLVDVFRLLVAQRIRIGRDLCSLITEWTATPGGWDEEEST